MTNPPANGTQKADVYSFAIIVHEIVTRQGPFYLGTDNLNPREIVQNVISRSKAYTAAPFRPEVDDCTIDDVRSIMERCWEECPNDRPDFRTLKLLIRKINK